MFQAPHSFWIHIYHVKFDCICKFYSPKHAARGENNALNRIKQFKINWMAQLYQNLLTITKNFSKLCNIGLLLFPPTQSNNFERSLTHATSLTRSFVLSLSLTFSLSISLSIFIFIKSLWFGLEGLTHVVLYHISSFIDICCKTTLGLKKTSK